MTHTLKNTLMMLALGALTFSPLGCDSETPDDDSFEAAREVEADVDAVFEAELLANEAREAGVEVEGYLCLYAETRELVEACALRATHTESQLAPELELTSTPSADEWTCVGHCGGETANCMCDSWCPWFGDCCWDYFDVC